MTSLSEMKQANPIFFENGKGKGERYNVHKNHLIITARDEFSGLVVSKVWRFIPEHGRFHRLYPEQENVAKAKRFIDKNLELAALNHNQLLDLIINSGLCDLREIFETGPKERLFEITNTMESVAQNLLRAAEYIGSRYSGSNHDGAVKDQNIRLTKVRKALGYSYPESNVNF